MSNEFWNRRSTVLAIWGLLVAGAVYVFSFEPGKTGFFPLCPFRLLTGLTCPGCGSTRAMHQLLHGSHPGSVHAESSLCDRTPVFVLRTTKAHRFCTTGKDAQTKRLAGHYIYLIFFVVLSFLALS
jgi:hypothetical protein